jgi:DNA replication and repair protein RecF
VFNRQVTFLGDAQKYARVLRSRNLLLREGRGDPTVLEVYDAQLAKLGARVVGSRRRYLAEVAPLFSEAYESITHSGLQAGLKYQTLEGSEGDDDAALERRLLDAIGEAERRDRARRQTTVGPHVDDLEISLGGRPARAFASQGQLRALVLAWKTAEMRLLRERLGDAPILLLDDVSSELDPTRNQFLFDFLASIDCQCFVTTTHPRHVPHLINRLDYHVVAGCVTPSK